MTGGPARLSLATLPEARDAERPGYDPRGIGIGIVHLGIGAFYRAHGAVYTDSVLALDGGDWGICGATQRSGRVRDQLAAQDGLYSVLVRDGQSPVRARVIGAVRELKFAAEDPAAVVALMAAPATRIVTLTVTEKGYRFEAGSGRLRDDDELAADARGAPPRTVVGQLVRGLQQRAQADGGPVALVSCDNLTGNGSLLRQLVGEFIERLPRAEAAALAPWVEQHAAFPSTMVDRIVPRTTDVDRADALRLLGLRDEGAVVAEGFSQWVVEDAFTGPRPAWEQAGATLTGDVAAYERVKLRLLNAAHSLIAYLGALAGCATIDQALADERIYTAARRLIDEDQRPTVTAPAGMDLDGYCDEVLRRFGNPALGHRTAQVAMDGSQKLPHRLVGAMRARRAAGATPRFAALLIASWVRAQCGTDDRGRPLHIEDPMGERIARMASRPAADWEIARDVLSVEEVFGPGLADDEALVAAVADWHAALRQHGALDALTALSG